MVHLAAVKRLYGYSPWLYAQIDRLYRASAYARYRNARIDRDVSKKLRERVEYERKIVNDYLNNDWTVRSGPFAGMLSAPVSAGSLLSPRIIGSHESPIHSWIAEAIAQNYEKILDIGSGEGYYAVGFALKSPTSAVYAYDINRLARDNTLALANLNRVEDRIYLRDLCTIDEFNMEVSERTLIFCDIEGGEFDLLQPDLAPGLLRADLIVEAHDHRRPGITETLVRRFLPSHRIEIRYHCAKAAKEFPILSAIPASEHARLLEEARPLSQCWIRFLANPSGAIKPVQWW
jgi:hypothetical protein